MLSFECIKNEIDVYFLLTSAIFTEIRHIRKFLSNYTQNNRK